MCIGAVVSILLLISHLLTDQQLVQFVTSINGYDLYTAFTGVEGLRLLYERKPDLIILHDVLPDLSFEQICHRIRHFADTPILRLCEIEAHTSSAPLEIHDSISTLIRPLQPTMLFAHIQQSLQHRQQRVSHPTMVVEPLATTDDLIKDVLI